MRKTRRTTSGFAVTLIAFYALATILLGMGAYWLSDRALNRQLDNRITAEAGLLTHIHSRGGVPALREVLLRRDNRGVNNLGYLLVDRAGRLLGGELNIKPPAEGWAQVEFRDLDEEVNDARTLTIVLPDGSRLTVAGETEPVQVLRHTLIWLFLVGLIVMLAGGLGGAFLFGRYLRQRIDLMNDTVLAIISGDMEQRIPIDNDDAEFARLAKTLNHMLDRNNILINSLRQVSSDIAHDLRTPIAHLRQRLERTLAATAPDSSLNREIVGAIEQSNAILSLFSALLRIAEVESGALRRYFRTFDLSATVRRIAESYIPAAEDGGRQLTCTIEDGIRVKGDAELLSQALVNLLENALRHTPPCSRIQLELSFADAHHTRLTVCDDGPGIPETQLPEITKRFTRADKARPAPGFGLGLNLVQAIVLVHEGKLVLANRNPGLGVEINLPVVST